MLLKMRSLPPKATPRPDTGILKAVEGSDENAARWFDMIQVYRKYPFVRGLSGITDNIALYLEQRQSAVFDPHDSRSLDLRYGAKLLPPTNIYA